MGRTVCEIILNNSISLVTHDGGYTRVYADQSGKVFEQKWHTGSTQQALSSLPRANGETIGLGPTVLTFGQDLRPLAGVNIKGPFATVWGEVQESTLRLRGPIAKRVRYQEGDK